MRDTFDPGSGRIMSFISKGIPRAESTNPGGKLYTGGSYEVILELIMAMLHRAGTLT